MGFKGLVINTLLVSLFVISIVYFAVNLTSEHNINQSIATDPTMQSAFGNVSYKLNQSSSDANKIQSKFVNETRNPFIAAVSFALESVFFAGNTLMNSVIGLFNGIFLLSSEALHISPIVTGTILAMLVIILVLFLWRVYRAGE